MAKLTGGGFTNLPPDARLWSRSSRSRGELREEHDEPERRPLHVRAGGSEGGDDPRHSPGVRAGRRHQPFYSYHLSTLTQSSPELGKTFRNQLLTLTTDLEGSSKWAGCSSTRSSAPAVGPLLARSRYLFMKLHRARFGDRTLAELRA